MTSLLTFFARLSGFALLLFVLVQFVVAVLRYVFGINFLWSQDFLVYLHAAVVTLGIGYALLHNRHIRIDIISWNDTWVRRIQIFGCLFFLVPFLLVVFLYGLSYFFSSLLILESSIEVSGLPGLFIPKLFVPLFSFLMFLGGIKLLWRLLR